MKRLPLLAGKIGFVLIALGVLAAITGAVLPGPDRLPLLPLAVGAFLYLSGAFLVVGAFDYQKGSKVFLTLRLARIVFAVSVVAAFVRAFGS
jgi:hypothetical protein